MINTSKEIMLEEIVQIIRKMKINNNLSWEIRGMTLGLAGESDENIINVYKKLKLISFW